MEQTFITGLEIKKVRHLENIFIPLDKTKRKHLIFTGKNGSGKTSVLKAMVQSFECVSTTLASVSEMKDHISYLNNRISILSENKDSEQTRQEIYNSKNGLKVWEDKLKQINVFFDFTSEVVLKENYEQGNFIFAHYEAEREVHVEEYKNIEKIQFKETYGIHDNPGTKLTKYLVDLKATQAFTKDDNKVKKISKWFDSFEKILKVIFEDENLTLEFDDDTFQFTIHQTGREPFDFNTMSSGYAAVFDIINDLIIRMEANSGLRTEFDMQGIVLIDEIETHLHLELQKKILPILTTLFPNLQFIITTHSPFILSSLDNAVIYDLENRTLVENGLNNLPYDGIVEGYFKADTLSDELRSKFERYKFLVTKDELSDEEYEEIDKLEFYLDEIPDYLAKELTAEYSRLKLEFSNRG